MKLSDNTSVSMPMRNLLSIVCSVAVGAWFAFGVIERLNIIEVELQLMQQDLLEASTQKPIDQEQFMLLEFLSKNQDKLKEQMESEIPMIQKNDMTIQFHEERLISLEEKQNGH
jgi:glycosylphosphatidylinositol transamidase (GPIT) subunit GPI8